MRTFITYFGYYIWLAFLYYFSIRDPRRVTVKERINHKTVTRYNWLFAFLAMLPLVYLTATRGNFGDTVTYRNGFKNAPVSFSEISKYVSTKRKDKAFYLLVAVLRCILGYRPVWYFAIIAFLQAVMMTHTLRRYSAHLLTGFFIFYASTDYISYMQNGIRQFLAAMIVFAASRYIFEKRYIPAAIAVFIASRFHASALIMLPVIFICQGEPYNKKTILMIILIFAVVLYVNQFTDLLKDVLEETQYTNVVSDWQSFHDDGANPFRVAVYSVPMFLSLLGLKYIREANDPVINICTNMSVVASGLYLIAMVTSGIYIGRLPIYACLYSNCILLPWEIEHFFNKSSSRIIRNAMFVCFLLFYYYQIARTWGMI